MTTCISVDSDTVHFFINVLNEVLYGFAADFSAIGSTRDQVQKLFEKVNSLGKAGGGESNGLTSAEARVLLSCSMLCLREIDEDEFFTRLGASSQAASDFIKSLSERLTAQPM